MTDPMMIIPGQVCQRHQVELLRAARITSAGPWRAAIVIANVALFQAAARDGRIWARCAGEEAEKQRDLNLVLAEIGCLGCFLPEAFQATIAVLSAEGLSALAKQTQEPAPGDHT